MKAERKTMMMVKTPTRVLFSLEWTILLESVCRGTGKSWEYGNNQKTDSEGVSDTEEIFTSFDLCDLILFISICSL